MGKSSRAPHWICPEIKLKKNENNCFFLTYFDRDNSNYIN